MSLDTKEKEGDREDTGIFSKALRRRGDWKEAWKICTGAFTVGSAEGMGSSAKRGDAAATGKPEGMGSSKADAEASCEREASEEGTGIFREEWQRRGERWRDGRL
jgi:hypothetical protein